MQYPSRKDLVKYFAEMMVVVLGILIAFQVDEWRDDLQVEHDRRAALVRLKEETQSNLAHCEFIVPHQQRLAASVQLVLNSVQSSQLREADIEEFKYGLTHIGFLPGRPFLTTVAEEMIATGLLKELDNPVLHTSIASALIQTRLLRENIANQSRFLQSIINELARSVEFSYVGTQDVDEFLKMGTIGSFEEGIDVSYELSSLSNNRYLRNLLFETTDGYMDLYRMNYQMCERIMSIDEQLGELGIE